MDFSYRTRMSAEQIEIADNFNDNLIDDIQLCISALREIDKIGKQGHVPLPATAASGLPMVHSANLQMFHVRQYWVNRLRLAVEVLGRDAINYIPDGYHTDARI